jgi:hypothetical protein
MIFSQSVLARRSGVSSPLQGLTVAASQVAIFLLPFSLVHYLPNFYYGALLAVLGVQICKEWLWNTVTRISMPEFVISWLSFSTTLTLTSLMPVQVCRRMRSVPDCFASYRAMCLSCMRTPAIVYHSHLPAPLPGRRSTHPPHARAMALYTKLSCTAGSSTQCCWLVSSSVGQSCIVCASITSCSAAPLGRAVSCVPA